jgi:hypothetical protein
MCSSSSDPAVPLSVNNYFPNETHKPKIQIPKADPYIPIGNIDHLNARKQLLESEVKEIDQLQRQLADCKDMEIQSLRTEIALLKMEHAKVLELE